jgi:hypothetical protein
MKALLLVVVLAAGFAVEAAAQSAEDLFQQALRVERVSGNTEAAIELYAQVVMDYPAEREVVARALLQMGKAFEVLGRDGAREAYGRIVAEYADFDSVAREAAERIAAFRRLDISESGGTPATRPEPTSRTSVGLNGVSHWGSSLSPTGRFLVGASDTRTGAASNGLTILEVATEERTFIPAAAGYQVWGNVRFSPDESKLAYSRSIEDSNADLMVVDIQSGRSSTLLAAAELGACSYSQVQDWSRDGSTLVVYAGWSDECGPNAPGWQEDILFVPLDGETPTRLNAVGDGVSLSEDACLTADGRYAFATVKEGEEWMIQRYNTETHEAAPWRGEGTWLVGCMWEPDRVLYASEGISGKTIRSGSPGELDSDTDEIVAQLDKEDWFFPVSNSKTGDFSIFSGGQVQRFIAAEYDTESGTFGEIREPAFASPVRWIEWSPSGNLLAQLSFMDGLRIWDSRDGGQEIIELEERPNISTGWITENTLWAFVPNLQAKDGDQTWDAVTLDLAERKVLTRLQATVADSLGFRVRNANPLDEGSWAIWVKDRGCIIKHITESHEQSDLKCFDAGSFQWVGLIPSPWEATMLTLGVRPDSTSVLGLMANDGSSYREIRVDHNRVFMRCTQATCMPFNGRQVSWVSQNEAMYGTIGPDGWESTLMIDLTTGESTEVLKDLREQFNPWLLAISPNRKHVAAYGEARGADGDDQIVATIIQNVFGDR